MGSGRENRLSVDFDHIRVSMIDSALKVESSDYNKVDRPVVDRPSESGSPLVNNG